MLEILKANGIEEEQANSIVKAMNEAKIYTTKLENIDDRYAKLKGQKVDLEIELKTSNDTITELKKSNKDNEALQQTIKDHETTIETMKTENEAKVKKMLIDNAINSKLAKVDEKYKKLLETQFDREKLVVKDETIEGIEEQFNVISETYKEWFTDTSNGGSGFNPSGLPNGMKNPFSAEHFNLTEQAKIYKENPNLAAQLRNAK